MNILGSREKNRLIRKFDISQVNVNAIVKSRPQKRFDLSEVSTYPTYPKLIIFQNSVLFYVAYIPSGFQWYRKSVFMCSWELCP